MTDESIFAAALAIPGAADRAAFLDRACAANPSIRKDVEELLAAHSADNPLDRPPADLARTGAYESEDHGHPTAVVGDRVGPYRLMEQVGEGGFGLVFVAEQTEPVRRKVALKVLKPGMDTREVVARFEAERQALALMDHPNIAKVFDAGSTEQGRPFFVMELVRGLPITEYCDRHALSLRDRLALFVQVCHAVQHAHQKGVIHRDLKPGNVLVAPHDGVPVVKVIDFGVAKAIGQSLTDKTIYTRLAQMIGTPLYMSPEQAEVNQLDVDTRSDVYALGVLLYELLTGTTPFDRDRFRRAAYDEIRRIIREEEPPRPSLRLSGLGETLSAVSAHRGTDAGRLPGIVRGELDWIVMRCLEKDRDRRYDTAVGLARDVQRYLGGDAVEACPPTLGYRLRKFVRRNRGPVAVGSVVTATLLAGVAGTTWGLVRAEAARAWAAVEEQHVRELLAESEDQRRAAELRGASAQIDLDLKYLETDNRLGLLRLARTLQALPPDARALREFTAMAVIASGQRKAPLAPPYRLSGWGAVGTTVLTPDGRTVLTAAVTPDGDATGSPLPPDPALATRLWDARTGRLLAVLRERGEAVQHARLSADGRVACTIDADSVARFWAIPSGRLAARTEPLEPRFLKPAEGIWWRAFDRVSLSWDGRRLAFARIMALNTYEGAWEVTVWDAGTGRRLARLPRFGSSYQLPTVALSPDGRLLVTGQAVADVRVWSADDGALLKTFGRGPAPVYKLVVAFSLSGRRLATFDGNTFAWRSMPAVRVEGAATSGVETRPGGPDGEVFSLADLPRRLEEAPVCDAMWSVTEDVFAASFDRGSGYVRAKWLNGGRGLVCVADRTRDPVRADGEVLVVGTDVTDIRSDRRLHPPAREEYHPALARFAVLGRWFNVGGGLVDLAVGKRFPTEWDSPATPLPGVGLVWAGPAAAGLIPLPDLLPPDDLLELWARVVARGELGPGGEFQAWDEKTWERNRRELAARPAPFPDFPFPGRVATDRLHWLRQEFSGYSDEGHAGQLLRRAEEVGDAAEAAYWRSRVAEAKKEAAPPPGKMKP